MKAMLVSLLVFGGAVTQSYGSSPKKTSPLPTMEMKDWLAVGSGCYGRKNKGGPVAVSMVQNPKNPLEYKVTFDLSSYGLDGDKPLHKERPTFARECSLRVAAHPLKGYRLADLRVDASLSIQKAKGAKAEINTRLLTGSGSLLASKRPLLEGKAEAKDLTLSLVPDQKGRQHMDATPCEEAKILGADFSLVSHRKSFKPKVMIKMKDPKVTMTIRLASCKKLAQPKAIEKKKVKAG